jgi:SAM-dependent methyltransferase
MKGRGMKAFWNERYASEDYIYGLQPNMFLALYRHLFRPDDKVLVVGDGEGRNGVWLAQQGFAVTSVDYAEKGVAKALALAKKRRTNIDAVCADLTEWDWPVGAYDRVVSVFLHFPSAGRAAMHRKMLEALKPGGLGIMEAFAKDQLNYHSGGPPDADLLYTADELRADFTGATFTTLEEEIIVLNESERHQGQAAVVRMIARKVG